MLCILTYGQRSFVILIPKKELEKEKEYGAQIRKSSLTAHQFLLFYRQRESERNECFCSSPGTNTLKFLIPYWQLH